jgi:hypothetical protein
MAFFFGKHLVFCGLVFLAVGQVVYATSLPSFCSVVQSGLSVPAALPATVPIQNNFALTIDFTQMYGMTDAAVLDAQRVALSLPVGTPAATIRTAYTGALAAAPTIAGTDIASMTLDYLDGDTNYAVEFLATPSNDTHFKGNSVSVSETVTWRLNYYLSDPSATPAPAPYSTILSGVICKGKLKLSTQHEFPVSGSGGVRVGLKMAADTLCSATASGTCAAACGALSKPLYKNMRCCGADNAAVHAVCL